MWIEQCRATRRIRQRFGAQAAFDYIVTEKLINYAGLAATRSELARELPQFVAEVRRLFTIHEIAREAARVDKDLKQRAKSLRDDPDDLFQECQLLQERRDRLQALTELLTAPQLETS